MAGIKATIKTERLNTKLSTKRVHVDIGGGGGAVAITDHAQLTHLGYEESGHEGFAGIEFGTTAEWNAMHDYRPPKGMIVVYTDYVTEIDPETGQPVVYAGFKIGDGNAYLIDKPFIGEEDRDILEAHLADVGIHVSAEDRERWNNKLNYEEPLDSDLLQFTRN